MIVHALDHLLRLAFHLDRRRLWINLIGSSLHRLILLRRRIINFSRSRRSPYFFLQILLNIIYLLGFTSLILLNRISRPDRIRFHKLFGYFFIVHFQKYFSMFLSNLLLTLLFLKFISDLLNILRDLNSFELFSQIIITFSAFDSLIYLERRYLFAGDCKRSFFTDRFLTGHETRYLNLSRYSLLFAIFEIQSLIVLVRVQMIGHNVQNVLCQL